jgi:uncharacterized phosphosugar-binding protein
MSWNTEEFMDTNLTNSGIDTYSSLIRDLQTRVIESQREMLGKIAGQMAATIQQEGRIFLFGTGHSHMLVEESFFRAGGLAAAVPILNTGLMLHENVFLSSRLERLPGLAGPLLEQFNPQPGEMLFVFSNSGVNHMPVEMAIVGKERGLVVVGVLSKAYGKVAPLSAIGSRLDEVVDYALDNGGEPGDGLAPVPDKGWRVGASSTIIGALLWNILVTETIYRLQASGSELPVLISFNMPNSSEHNQSVLEKWGKRNPYVKGWLNEA